MPLRTTIPPLFKWAGSKQRMLDQYAPVFFPPAPPERFVDLFAGGLTVTLWVAEHYPDTHLVINDFNPELMDLYSALSSYPDAVIDVWRDCVQQWLPLTPEQRKALYYTWRTEYTLHPDTTPPERLAGLLLFMLQTNFNGMWKAYIKCNGRYSTPPGTCTQKAGFFDEDRIRAVAALLAHAELHCADFAAVPLQPGDFVYADPPYRASIVDYQGGFTEDDQVRLARLLTQHNGPYAYSNKDIGDGWYAREFPHATIHDLTARYTAGRGTAVHDVREVLVTNYPPAPEQPSPASPTD